MTKCYGFRLNTMAVALNLLLKENMEWFTTKESLYTLVRSMDFNEENVLWIFLRVDVAAITLVFVGNWDTPDMFSNAPHGIY